MDWTPEQDLAIKTEGDDLLVAAGAGSGKTAVLVARILRKILGEDTTPCNVDRLLIVTFTNAAAREMRQRLFEALDERLLDENITDELARRIYLQQTLLAKATITTIHGFCNKVVLGNSKESGIDGSFRVGDQAETEILLQESAEEVCESYSKQDPVTYEALVDTYGSYRSDDEVLAYVKRIARFALAFPDPQQWICKHTEQFGLVNADNLPDTPWGKTLLRNLRLEMQAQWVALEQLYQIALMYDIAPYIQTLEADRFVFKKAKDQIDDENVSWADAKRALEQLEFDRLNSLRGKAKTNLSAEAGEATRSFPNRRSDIRDRIKEIKHQYFSAAIPEPHEQAAVLRDDLAMLGKMACSLLDVFNKKKRENHLLDYSDLEHIAYRILREEGPDGKPCPSNVAKRYQTQFKEIFIDEYQDTNLIQEEILTLVSNKWNGTPNLFMVGDIKQSVYGFRQACPDLFLDKYMRYKDARKDTPSCGGARVCLYMNFRSRKPVLDTVNHAFRGLMRENTCGMVYTEAEYLNYGATYYDKAKIAEDQQKPDPRTEVVLVSSENFKDKQLPELHEVARRIETMIAEQYPVYDRHTKSLRPICYSDICILLRVEKGKGKIYQDYLMSRGIPTLCDEESKFFARPEVQTLLSFLRVLDNPRQDIPLIAVLRNIYGVPEALLSEIMLNESSKSLCFWERVCRYGAKQGGVIAACVARIEQLRLSVRDCTVGEIVWQCMHENGFFDALLTRTGGDVARQNLLLLMNRAVRYDADTNKGFYTFINRLDQLEKGSSDVPGAGAVNDGLNAVQIMTIHGSKGLEFPVVFLCQTGPIRKTKEDSGKLLMHRDLGFGPTCYDRAQRLLYPSIMRMAVKQQKELDAKAEELRVLYVAMTRAREKLIVTGTVPKSTEDYIEEQKLYCDMNLGIPLDYYVLHTKDFLGLLVMALGIGFSDSYKIQPARFTEELEDLTAEPKETAAYSIELPSMPLYKAAADEPVGMKKVAPAKVSVSQLGKTDGEPFYPEIKPYNKAPADHTVGGARVGTLIHSALQQAAYDRFSDNRDAMERYTEELLRLMVERGFITEEERALVPVETLVDYFTSDFALRLSRAEWMMREVPFTFLCPWKELTGEDLPGETAVQGVMDCIAQIDGKLVLVDFKSDRVNGDYAAYSKRYKTQISVYREACLRAFGKAPDEVYLYYLRGGHPERIVL